MLVSLEALNMATALGKFLGDAEPESDFVPPVDAADIRNMLKMGKELQALFPDEQIMVGIDLFTELYGPGANVRAVYERFAKIGLLQVADILKPNETIKDVVFDALATIPMKRMKAGVVYEGFPFDIEEFYKRIGEQV
jgi:hypothetical protein